MRSSDFPAITSPAITALDRRGYAQGGHASAHQPQGALHHILIVPVPVPVPQPNPLMGALMRAALLRHMAQVHQHGALQRALAARGRR